MVSHLGVRDAPFSDSRSRSASVSSASSSTTITPTSVASSEYGARSIFSKRKQPLHPTPGPQGTVQHAKSDPRKSDWSTTNDPAQTLSRAGDTSPRSGDRKRRCTADFASRNTRQPVRHGLEESALPSSRVSHSVGQYNAMPMSADALMHTDIPPSATYSFQSIPSGSRFTLPVDDRSLAYMTRYVPTDNSKVLLSDPALDELFYSDTRMYEDPNWGDQRSIPLLDNYLRKDFQINGLQADWDRLP